MMFFQSRITWFFYLLLFLMFGMGCFSFSQKLPFKIKEVYYESWVAPVNGGGYGKIIFLEMDVPFLLDSIAFYDKVAKVSYKPFEEKHIYTARFNFYVEEEYFIKKNNGSDGFKAKKERINLLDGGVILFYTYKKKQYRYRIENIKERKNSTKIEPM